MRDRAGRCRIFGDRDREFFMQGQLFSQGAAQFGIIVDNQDMTGLNHEEFS